MHPVLAVALGEADEVIVQFPVARRLRARRRARSPSAQLETRPASTCSRSAAAGATSTARVATCGSQAGDELLAQRSRRGPGACSPSSAASASSRTTTPARSSSSPSPSARRLSAPHRPTTESRLGTPAPVVETPDTGLTDGRGSRARRARAHERRAASARAAPTARSSGPTSSPGSTRSSARCSSSSWSVGADPGRDCSASSSSPTR